MYTVYEPNTIPRTKISLLIHIRNHNSNILLHFRNAFTRANKTKLKLQELKPEEYKIDDWNFGNVVVYNTNPYFFTFSLSDRRTTCSETTPISSCTPVLQHCFFCCRVVVQNSPNRSRNLLPQAQQERGFVSHRVIQIGNVKPDICIIPIVRR